MRLTITLYHGIRNHTQRNFNRIFKRSRFYDEPLKIPAALTAKGIPVVDLTQTQEEPRTKFIPPVPDDPRWLQEPLPEDRADWQDQKGYSFTHAKTQLFEGVNQACLIAKAQHFEGLPKAVEQLVGVAHTPDRDLLLQRYIMLSQFWNTDDSRLEKRPSPPHVLPLWNFRRKYGSTDLKSSQIMMQSLLRLCQSQVVDVPSLENRRHVYEPSLHSYVMYRDEPVVQMETLDCVVTSDSWLPPFADESTVDESVTYKIPDMWPVLPTVDFTPTNNYELFNNIGFSTSLPKSIPNTIIQIPRMLEWQVDVETGRWSDSQYQAAQIMTCLMYTAALARKQYGDNVGVLPEPISIQHIALKSNSFLITCFQLNTLDLSSDVGVKNLVWTADKLSLFDKCLSEPWLRQHDSLRDHLVNFDGSSFERFLAAYLNGCPELVPSS